MRVTILAHLSESPKFFQTAVKVHLWVKVLWSGFKRMTNVQSVCHVPHKTWYCFPFVKAAECQRGFLLVQVSPSPELFCSHTWSKFNVKLARISVWWSAIYKKDPSHVVPIVTFNLVKTVSLLCIGSTVLLDYFHYFNFFTIFICLAQLSSYPHASAHSRCSIHETFECKDDVPSNV